MMTLKNSNSSTMQFNQSIIKRISLMGNDNKNVQEKSVIP